MPDPEMKLVTPSPSPSNDFITESGLPGFILVELHHNQTAVSPWKEMHWKPCSDWLRDEEKAELFHLRDVIGAFWHAMHDRPALWASNPGLQTGSLSAEESRVGLRT